MERSPAWENPYDSILQTTLNCVMTGGHGNDFRLQGVLAKEEGKSLKWVSGTGSVLIAAA